EEARQASLRTVQRYTVAEVRSFFRQVRTYIDVKEWKPAAVRLDDMAEQIAQLGHIDTAWNTFVEEARSWVSKLRELKRGRMPESLSEKWGEFAGRLQAKIDSSYGILADQSTRGSEP